MMGVDVIVNASVQQLCKSVEDLKKSIDQFSASSDRYSERLLVLTWVIAFLTLIMAVPIIIGFISWVIPVIIHAGLDNKLTLPPQ